MIIPTARRMQRIPATPMTAGILLELTIVPPPEIELPAILLLLLLGSADDVIVVVGMELDELALVDGPRLVVVVLVLVVLVVTTVVVVTDSGAKTTSTEPRLELWYPGILSAASELPYAHSNRVATSKAMSPEASPVSMDRENDMLVEVSSWQEETASTLLSLSNDTVRPGLFAVRPSRAYTDPSTATPPTTTSASYMESVMVSEKPMASHPSVFAFTVNVTLEVISSKIQPTCMSLDVDANCGRSTSGQTPPAFVVVVVAPDFVVVDFVVVSFLVEVLLVEGVEVVAVLCVVVVVVVGNALWQTQNLSPSTDEVDLVAQKVVDEGVPHPTFPLLDTKQESVEPVLKPGLAQE
jgi:hypothetical protein